jgi:3-deoxy-D-manno-octulosonate 8-phosphate phosphatase (KDO 8-P phosphatase)
MDSLVTSNKLRKKNIHLANKARKIKLVLTDNDGVLTDTGVYYSDRGEMLKRFSIRDGMGVARLKKVSGIETGIITGELSPSVKKRAEKLGIKELHLGVKDKITLLKKILRKKNLQAENIAFIGDDVNDIELIKSVGLSAAPADAMPDIKNIVDYLCEDKGGNGAFREFAELIIVLNQKK